MHGSPPGTDPPFVRSGLHEIFIDGLAPDRAGTIDDPAGAIYKGVDDARHKLMARTREEAASFPEGDWDGWTWTAQVTVEFPPGEDKVVNICAATSRTRADGGLDFEWSFREPEQRYWPRIDTGNATAVWLDLHSGLEADAANPFTAAGADRDGDRVKDRDRDRLRSPRADGRERPPKGW